MKLSTLAEKLDGELEGPDGELEVSGISTLQEADPSQVCYFGNPIYRKYLGSTKALAIITSSKLESSARNLILVEKPYHAFRKALILFHHPVPSGFSGIHSSAVIHPSAVLATGVTVGPNAVIDIDSHIGTGSIIGPGAVIGSGACVGSNSFIGCGVVIYRDCILGDRVIIHANAVIGSDGFGFIPDPEGHLKVPQNGNVVIEDDVEIGAGCTIDRAVTGSTVIGKHSKLDNLIHIAHNVTIGPGTMLAAQTGIAGSSSLGSGVIAGGQAGISGHINIGDGVRIGAQAGVSKDVPPGITVSGYPARLHDRSLRISAALAELPEFRREVIAFMRKFKNTEEEK